MDIRRRCVYAGDRRVHYRRAGSGPPLVMLHASPGSTYALEPLIALLGETRTVIAVDSPGYGESAGLGLEEPETEDFAAALVETFDALGLDRVDLYGTHTGSKIAVEFTGTNPGRVRRLVLDGIGAYTPEEREDLLANYTIDLSPRWDGSHLVRAWAMRRDMHMFWAVVRQGRRSPPGDGHPLDGRDARPLCRLPARHPGLRQGVPRLLPLRRREGDEPGHRTHPHDRPAGRPPLPVPRRGRLLRRAT